MSAHFDESPIPISDLAYERQRMRNHIHDLVLGHFLRLSSEADLTKAKVARRLSKRPEQITRWLSAPGNWTLDTISDLMVSMGLDPTSLFQADGNVENRDGKEGKNVARSAQTALHTSLERGFGSYEARGANQELAEFFTHALPTWVATKSLHHARHNKRTAVSFTEKSVEKWS